MVCPRRMAPSALAMAAAALSIILLLANHIPSLAPGGSGSLRLRLLGGGATDGAPPPPPATSRHGCHNPNQLALVETNVGVLGTPDKAAPGALPPPHATEGHPRGMPLLPRQAEHREHLVLVALGASFGPGLPSTREDALTLPLAVLAPAAEPEAPGPGKALLTPTPPPHSLPPLPGGPSPIAEWLPGVSLACPQEDSPSGWREGQGAALQGQVVLVQRGNCTFVDKALTVQALGGRAMLVANTDEELLGMGCNDTDAEVDSISIPVLLISHSSAQQLLSGGALNSSQVVLTLYAPPRSLLDPSEALLWALAVSLLAVAASWAAATARDEDGERKRQGQAQESGDAQQGQKQGEAMHEINLAGAVSFVFISSAVLLLLFFFMSPWVFHVLLFFFCLMAFEAMNFCFASLLYFWSPDSWRPCGLPLWAPLFSLPLLGPMSMAGLACGGTSLALVLLWVLERHAGWAWLMQDLFGSCLILTVLQTVRLPNIKVSTVLLVLAFAYDIFWVFLSPLFFSGESVMVEVASGRRSGGEQLPLVLLAPRLLGPWGGSSILGLGDVVLPGLLVVFTKRFDLAAARQGSSGYFSWTLGGYATGLLLTYLALLLMDGQGQPALLYLVPCTLGVVLYLGWRRGDLWALWSSGSPQEGPSEEEAGGLLAEGADQQRGPPGVQSPGTALGSGSGSGSGSGIVPGPGPEAEGGLVQRTGSSSSSLTPAGTSQRWREGEDVLR